MNWAVLNLGSYKLYNHHVVLLGFIDHFTQTTVIVKRERCRQDETSIARPDLKSVELLQASWNILSQRTGRFGKSQKFKACEAWKVMHEEKYSPDPKRNWTFKNGRYHQRYLIHDFKDRFQFQKPGHTTCPCSPTLVSTLLNPESAKYSYGSASLAWNPASVQIKAVKVQVQGIWSMFHGMHQLAP